ncbi:PREDICTED: ubiquitin carboxyl-terminal hydrolase 47 [Dufourea novaeangliae]|uniref:Ubiquitin carboxyl-terminal hydrolase 47 n=1 Tax=Dufourea novaeangliae TaxID=178035 RepID=A0A154PAP6_DUFNO|nr:PREDICTED: ubiquitin carboxyl-terminal hydrolase 47 [Dufourea novaeangliae]XP_015430038.1 PREDICTED: ubiquitin carboxyl-terminal hydrolase 47 [Dufourea novaeangliae]KZC08270.1 Ubiquitin carboxyl-terminal hydrolase 64E [Dufourea novaeangliae]
MVLKIETCLIECHLFGGTKDNCISDVYPLYETTCVKDLYIHVEKHYQLPPDSFKLYLVSTGKQTDLCGMKDKLMSEIGVDFSDKIYKMKNKCTVLVVNTIDTLTQKETEYDVSTDNSPPVSPQHTILWGEDDNDDFKCFIKPKTGYVGLVNQAMTCYLNSLLQALYMTPEFRNALYNWEYASGAETDEANSIPYQLQKLFLNLQTSSKSAVETTALTKSFGWNSTEAWQQHDIQELCRVMFEALEQKFKNTEQADLINRFYEGKMIDYVKCLECGTEKSREDTFLDIPLPVRPFDSNVAYNTVEAALKAFVQYETLEGSNQYHCEKCNKKCDAHKGLKFTKFPYLLTLHLKRFDFDFKTFHRVKLNDKVTFPNILNLNPFILSTTNQEFSVSEETVSSVKCDDSSTTDSGTLDHDFNLCEYSLPNSNCSRNHDLDDDDEGVDVLINDSSTSNCTEHNHENEKNRSSDAVKGPYNYELFSIMIHSGSASGGHYYAYIKDFRTQEWLCFNDQNVTQITNDDIQKTYGGGPTRSYYSGACSSTNAYMLMYRQIDPSRNVLPMQVQDFPNHIQELLKKMKENEDNDRKKGKGDKICFRKNRRSYLETSSDDFLLPKRKVNRTIRVEVGCIHPSMDIMVVAPVQILPTITWAMATKQCWQTLDVHGIVSLNKCRLVCYDESRELIVCSYEGLEERTFNSIWNRTEYTLFLDIMNENQKAEKNQHDVICTNVCTLDVTEKKITEGPFHVRALPSQTVGEYKRLLSSLFGLPLSEMTVILRGQKTHLTLLEYDDVKLSTIDFSDTIDVFVSTMRDNEWKSFLETATSCEIITNYGNYDNVITVRIKIPKPSEINKEWNIPSLDVKSKDTDKPIDDSPSNVNVNDSHRSTSPKRNEVLKIDKGNEDVPPKTASPQLGEVEEWNTPEQSNSEDSSLSDSDKTLVGDAPDDEFQVPYFQYTKTLSVDILNPICMEQWDCDDDDKEHYFKVTDSEYLKLEVARRMKYSTFKKKLERYVGVPSEYFKIFHNSRDLDDLECDSLQEKLVFYKEDQILHVKIGRFFEFKTAIYQLRPNPDEIYKFLGEWIFCKDMTVAEAKKEILADIKRKHDIDIPFERCRLRKKFTELPATVYVNDQKLEDLQLYSNTEMVIQKLPDKDPFTSSSQVIVRVQKYIAGRTLCGSFQEIVVDGKSIKEIRKKLSEISDIPEEHIEIVKIDSEMPVFPALDIDENTVWYGYDSDVEFKLDNETGLLYRDNRHNWDLPKPMRRDDYSLRIQEFGRAVVNHSSRKDTALRIHLTTTE